MAHTVSNDALWEKLIEIDKKLDKLSVVQKTSSLKEEITGINTDFDSIKEEIITEIKQQARLLGYHSDINFKADRQNLKLSEERILMIKKMVTQILQQQNEAAQPQKENEKDYFDFKFFKVRKTSLIIAILSLLIFFLTLFCMKQQNDYSLLINEFSTSFSAFSPLFIPFRQKKEQGNCYLYIFVKHTNKYDRKHCRILPAHRPQRAGAYKRKRIL